ncbi:hypothetical protein TUM4261_26750 [Shewanella sp. c952]|nr:hypothetical protein TUM4261_26750 [Shewanella sp. c952]
MAIDTMNKVIRMMPNFFKSVMRAIEEVTLMATSGTMIINSKFRNTWPMGFSDKANSGNTIPIAPPMSSADKRIIDER